MPKETRSIKLTFEAKGDGHKKGDYMVEDRSNICVSCGKSQYLTVHHVVPEMYRHWMPLAVKSKSVRGGVTENRTLTVSLTFEKNRVGIYYFYVNIVITVTRIKP